MAGVFLLGCFLLGQFADTFNELNQSMEFSSNHQSWHKILSADK